MLTSNKQYRFNELKSHIGFLLVVFVRYGGLAVLLQTSPESANIFVLLQRVFRKQTPEQLEQVAKAAGLSSEEYQVHQPFYGGFSWIFPP